VIHLAEEPRYIVLHLRAPIRNVSSSVSGAFGYPNVFDQFSGVDVRGSLILEDGPPIEQNSLA
jgi:hypothetical protein